ncbi:MAG: methylated-DNA--[protein]-cysteine S-methyltransferase [Moraxella sp.]|nr:methylated-DNA--[protein]-cysteine S-methyltransferase [Moraxella sp.]
MHTPFNPVNIHNKIALISIDKHSDNYWAWLNAQDNPPKSYLQHPFDSEAELSAAKKQFKKQHGLSLGAYIRIKRIHYLLNHSNQYKLSYTYSYIPTPIGLMLAISSKNGLCLLEFLDRKMLETEIVQIIKIRKCSLAFHADYHHHLQQQLHEYFNRQRQIFDVAIDPIGTEFQLFVWQALMNIPFGERCSYSEQAEKINHVNAVRAVANANGKNKISIIIPCHRVLQKDGELGGYGGGVARKRFLLDLESIAS